METVITIGLIILFIIYLLAQDSKKETKKEKYGEALVELASMAADSVSGMAFKLTEPAEKKKIRLARENLADRHGDLYRFEFYDDTESLKRKFQIDENFKKSLDILGLSEERWLILADDLFYIGVIRKESRDERDYSKKIPKI